jgi:hypothetical protein
MTLSRFQLWYGRDEAPAPTHELRAGPVTALLENGDLRRLRIGGVEIAQRIYVAVRDSAWNTIPATYSNFQYDLADDHFTVTFQAHHTYQDLDFAWQGTITGAPDGTISFTMDGVAKSAFRYNKIGFNVHHPLRECVGRPYQARSPAGTTAGVLPVEIEPQRLVDGQLTALFPPYDHLSIALAGGLDVRFDFAGDLFEMQDHRNWTDANYKSYSTPMSVPYPIEAQAGGRIRQTVTVSVGGALPRPRSGERNVRLTLGDALGHGLPPIGTVVAGHGEPLSAREAELLRRLRLAHLRVDLYLRDPSYPDVLRRAAADGDALEAPLEPALFIRDDAGDEVERCAALLRALPRAPAHVLVYQDAADFSPLAGGTPAHTMRLVRERLQPALPGVPLFGGTNQFFAELNRDRPDAATMDGLVYSINPQVHAADDTSLIENLAAQADTVAMARSLYGGLPIAISPVTFIGRFGPWAAGPPEPGKLPPQVDVRQAALFGAGWTAGSIKYLAESGAAALTYYETTGWLGLMERASGAPRPALFPSEPGSGFPLYHVFADLADWQDGEIAGVQTTDPLGVVGLAVRLGGRLHLLAANLGPTPRGVTIGPLASSRARVRSLDDETAPMAMRDPDRFRSSGAVADISGHELTLTLAPFAIAHIDEIEL